MKNKSLFLQTILLVIVIFLCFITTISMALLAGSVDKALFDFSNLNIKNMIPVLIFGGITSCFIIGVVLLFTSRTLFHKIKKYFDENENQK